MLSLLLGSDDFSKKQFIDELAKEQKADVVFFGSDDNPSVEELIQADLFNKAKVFGLKNLVGNYNRQSIVEKFIVSKNHIIVIEEKLDKRLTENKQLVANKNITTKEFSLPHGRELNDWIMERAKALGGKIQSPAAEALAQALGQDDAREIKVAGKIVSTEEIYSLWQADGDMQKLIALRRNREITPHDDAALTPPNREVDVFELTNAIADGQKQKAMNLMNEFLAQQTGSEEKGAVIQLNALLSEQFRNVAAVQDFLVHKKSESDILETTGWKSGRLFVLKKIASRFSTSKVLELLKKLEHLDTELKSTSTPPRVLLDLIILQLL